MTDDGNATDWSKKLPPEIWATIFKHLHPKKDVAPLRLVSSHLKDLVDNLQVYNAKIDGRVSRRIPPAHVKLGSIKVGNFTHPFQLPKYRQLNCLKRIKFYGPCHSYVVQKLLNDSLHLRTLNIGGSTLRMDAAGYIIPKLLPEHKKIKNLFIHKSNELHYEGATPREIEQENQVLVSFLRMMSSGMLHESVHLPVLTHLHLEYMDMPIMDIQNLINGTILPFIWRHSASLTRLCLVFVPPIRDDSPVPFKLKSPVTEDLEPHVNQLIKSRQLFQFQILNLRLPEAILNCMLGLLYNCNNNTSTSHKMNNGTESILMDLACVWERPYQSAKKDEEQAFLVLQNLICTNQQSLNMLYLENVNATNILLCGHSGAHCKFQKLKELSIIGRPMPRPASNCNVDAGNDDMVQPNNIYNNGYKLFQSKLVVQNFPCLEYLRLYNLGLKPKPLQKMINNSLNLIKVKLQDNMYYHNNKIESWFLSRILTTWRINKIVIGSRDLYVSFRDAYWDDFKQILFPAYSYEYDDHDSLRIKKR